jgi:hypothetical protein
MRIYVSSGTADQRALVREALCGSGRLADGRWLPLEVMSREEVLRLVHQDRVRKRHVGGAAANGSVSSLGQLASQLIDYGVSAQAFHH